ncbi:MAG TPA: anti-sigma factor [Solirubrobacteraceae bacterium]|jgi:anti-sigma-K factor RskA|nr:anti-sigma factor [Solirubrobacteraceae bacterium]
MNKFSNQSECEERGQAAAYVLSALERGEAASFREHLSCCAVCRADVASLQPVVDSLPGSVPHAVASQELRERVMASVRSEAELLHAAGAGADRPQPARPRRRSRRLQILTVAGAMGLGVLVGAIALDTGSQTPTTHVSSAQLASLPLNAKAVLRQVGAHAELVMSGVSQPPSGKIYELWLAREGKAPQPTDALFGVTHSGSASVNVPGNLAGVRQVMVTAEPLGGSPHPTSSAIIVATLHSS